MFAQFKHAFQHPLARSLGCVLLTHYLFPNKEGKSVAIVYQNETIWTAEDNFFSLYLLIRQRLRHANWHDENVKLTIKERHVPDRSGIFRLRRYAGRGCVLLTHYQFPNKEGKFVAILYQNATIGLGYEQLFSLILLIRQRLRGVNKHDVNVKLAIRGRHVPDRSGIF